MNYDFEYVQQQIEAAPVDAEFVLCKEDKYSLKREISRLNQQEVELLLEILLEEEYLAAANSERHFEFCRKNSRTNLRLFID